jgi:hypothetical protein
MTDSRPPSVVSSGTDYDNEDYAGELWDELEVVLQVQEDDFVEQDEATATGVPGSLFNVTKRALPYFSFIFPYQNNPTHHGQGDPTWDLQRTNQKMSTRQSPS